MSNYIDRYDPTERFPTMPYVVATHEEHFESPHPHLAIENPIQLPEQLFSFFELLTEFGFKGLIVGGSARDALFAQVMGVSIEGKDIDVEVFGTSEDILLHLLARHFGQKAIHDEVGKSFSVIKVDVDGLNYAVDFSLPRSEKQLGKTHKSFEATPEPGYSLSQAASRRDLRVNALYYDPLTKCVIDPINGSLDFETKTLAVVKPETFIEDPLRILRVAQFAARMQFEPSPETIELCRAMVAKNMLNSEPTSRVTGEIEKLFKKGIKPSIGIRFLEQIGFVDRYWPELAALKGIQQSPQYHPEGDAWTHTLQTIDAAKVVAEENNLSDKDTVIFCLSMLCHDLGKKKATIWDPVNEKWSSKGHEEMGVTPTISFMNRLEFPKNYTPIILEMVKFHMRLKLLHKEFLKGVNTDNAFLRLANELQHSSMQFLLLVTLADHRGRNGNEDRPLLHSETPGLDELAHWVTDNLARLNIEHTRAEPLLSGDVLKTEISRTPGAWIGVIKKCVYLDQLDGIVTTPEEALIQAKNYFHFFVVKHGADNMFDQQLWLQYNKTEDPRDLLS